MSSPYAEVARTYLHSRVIRVATAFGLVFVFPVLPIATRGMDPDQALPLFLLCFSSLAGFVCMHLKEQFSNPRSRVVPGFARPHLVVAAVLLVGTCASVSALSAWLSPVSFLTLFCLTLATAGVVARSLFWPPLAQVMIYPVLFIPLLRVGELQLLPVLLDPPLPGCLAIALAGAWLLVTGGRKLLDLDEDHPAYRRALPQPVDLGFRIAVETGGRERWWTRIQAGFRDRRLARAFAPPAGGTLGAMRRLRAASGEPLPLSVFGLAVIVAWIFSGFSLQRVGPMSVILLALLPAFMRGTRRMLTLELMRPVTRADLVRRTWLRMASDLGQLWLVLMITGLLGSLSSPLHRDWQAASFERGWAGSVLFCAAALPFFAAVTRLTLVRSEGAFTFGTAACSTLTLVGIVWILSAVSSPARLLGVSAALLLAGGILTGLAYRAWLRAEL
jgi:hypothetical protein